MDALTFVRAQPPFDQLGEEDVRLLERHLETVYFPSGKRIFSPADPVPEHLYVVRKGVVRIKPPVGEARLIEEGETFGLPPVKGTNTAGAIVVADEDVLAHRIPSDVFDRLLTNPSVAGFFVRSLPQRLQHLADIQMSSLAGDMAVPLDKLLARPVVSSSKDTTVRQAARAMSENRISSLVIEADPPGIVTDRDLRNRVLAYGLGPETPVHQVMSSPIKGLPKSTPTFGALMLMLDEGIHHVAVLDGGRVVGVVTDTDILRHQSKTPIYLHKWIERLERPEDLAGYGNQVASMAQALLTAGLDPLEIGRVIATLNDAVTRRLLLIGTDAERTSSPDYAWIVFGSEGRMEQLLLTDQDNGLVLDDQAADDDGYFSDLSTFVIEGLLQAGFPRCRGDCMATRLRYPRKKWLQMFSSWIQRPDREAAFDAAIMFDMRRVGGSLDLEELENIMMKVGRNDSFMRRFAKVAIRTEPPLTFFRRIRGQDGGLDLKTSAIGPIVAIAKLSSLEAGTRGVSTVERLATARDAGTLPSDAVMTLTEAFRFALRLRLSEQLDAYAAGLPLSNRVSLEKLSALERRHLREALMEIRNLQSFVAARYNLRIR
jgi:CBS domain-containing protein